MLALAPCSAFLSRKQTVWKVVSRDYPFGKHQFPTTWLIHVSAKSLARAQCDQNCVMILIPAFFSLSLGNHRAQSIVWQAANVLRRHANEANKDLLSLVLQMLKLIEVGPYESENKLAEP